MKKFYISASTPHADDKLTLYAIESDTLENLGPVEQLVHVKDDVYQAGISTLLIKDNKVSVLSSEAIAMPIIEGSLPKMPENIKHFIDTASVAKATGQKNSAIGAVYEQYLTLMAEFSDKLENLIKNAIVLYSIQKVQLLIKGQDGVYHEEPNITTLPFYDGPAFIYQGGFFVKKSGYVRIEPRLLFAAANYMILWCGGNMLFALEVEGHDIHIKSLGCFDKFVPTKVSQVLKLKDEIGCDVLYNLGNNLQMIYRSSDDTRCTIEESGRIIREYEVVYDGVPYPETIIYNCVDGQYKS